MELSRTAMPWFRGGLCCVVIFLICFSSCLGQGGGPRSRHQQNKETIPNQELENWALSFGTLLWETARAATKFDAIQKKYHTEGAKVETVDGYEMIKNMVANVETMLVHKIDAIKRIMEQAENLALDHKYDKSLRADKYLNAKRLNIHEEGMEDRYENYYSMRDRDMNDPFYRPGFSRLVLEANKYFSGIPVNVSETTVHVPTNVFDGDPKVINAIMWSERLTDAFIDNYKRDPSLSWQYFGSSTGFLRQYPAMKWIMDEHDPDLYDARMRDWYIKAAASPKEIVILLDTSGSMTGLRKEIAKHVVFNILETLTENDFVAIYKFSKEPEPLVECFTNEDGYAEMVQATNENIRQYKEAVAQVATEEIANFTSALTVAFELLTKTRGLGVSSVSTECNQAVMIVTDGVPYKYEAVFKKYNMPHKPVRVFTYLIGREISDLKAARWMACQNRGYFTHVTTLAEVKEQVLKYIPVLARPMVMFREKHPVKWTGVYADIEDPKTSRWLWDIRERARQKKRTRHYREIMGMQEYVNQFGDMTAEEYSAEQKERLQKLTLLSDTKQMENFLSYGRWDLNESKIERIRKDEEIKRRLVHELTEAKTQKWAIPPKDLTKLIEREIRSILDEEEEEDEEEEQLYKADQESNKKFTGYRLMTSVSIPVFDKKNHTVRIAELLGVAGTDVPIREIEKLTPPWQLGVNGYSFAINNNGYILFHPDLRPMFQEILKPNYNSVDLTEVELPESGSQEPRGNHSELLSMRKVMIDQEPGASFMTVKQHFDDMKRATTRTLDYYYHGINPMSPFSLGIALPRTYGKYRLSAEKELSLIRFNVSEYLDLNDWRIHPDWVYCQYNYAGDGREFDTAEDNMRHFILRAQRPGWNWGTSRVVPLPMCANQKQYDPNCPKSKGLDEMESNSHMCNRDLVQAMIFDAIVTKDFEKQHSPRQVHKAPNPFKNQTYKRFGIQLSFIATRSGFLRFSDHSALFRESQAREPKFYEPHFADINNKAIDEVWYKRAVDYHYVNPYAFVYSVPFDIGRNKANVTATHAIMVGKGVERAPAAVAGMQIDYTTFREMFFNETEKCVMTKGGKNDGSCRTCNDGNITCYVIDNNGFVIIAPDEEHTGKFFGEVDGTIFESLVQHRIYKQIKIYDYQAICLEQEDDGSSASMLLTPFKMLGWAFNYMIAQVAWALIHFEIRQLWNPDWTYAYPQNIVPVETEDYYSDNLYQAYDDMGENVPMTGIGDNPLMDEFSIRDGGGPIPLLQMTYINKTTPKPCDKEVILYELNDEKLYKPNKRNGKPLPVKGKLSNCHPSGCERPFSIQLIPHTNLVLIAADTQCPCYSTKITVEPKKITYGDANNTELAYCEKLKNNIYRKQDGQCVAYHPEESEIKLCGGSNSLLPSWFLLGLAYLPVVRLLS